MGKAGRGYRPAWVGKDQRRTLSSGVGVGVGTANCGLGAIRATTWCDPSLTPGADLARATDGEVGGVAVNGFGAGAGVTLAIVPTGDVGTVGVTAMGCLGTVGAWLPLAWRLWLAGSPWLAWVLFTWLPGSPWLAWVLFAWLPGSP